MILSIINTNKAQTATQPKVDKGLNKLAQLMQGIYNSKSQSITDTTYYNISLIMAPIWTHRTDGKWLYVEQAMATTPDKPYRQRVYHLQHKADKVYTSDIYTIKDAMAYANATTDTEKMAKLTFDKIELKDGFTVTLNYKKKQYTGGTNLNDCPSDLRGAKYATTIIELNNTKLLSWDRGFDANGKQVWGATKGGYVFNKQ